MGSRTALFSAGPDRENIDSKYRALTKVLGSIMQSSSSSGELELRQEFEETDQTRRRYRVALKRTAQERRELERSVKSLRQSLEQQQRKRRDLHEQARAEESQNDQTELDERDRTIKRIQREIREVKAEFENLRGTRLGTEKELELGKVRALVRKMLG